MTTLLPDGVQVAQSHEDAESDSYLVSVAIDGPGGIAWNAYKHVPAPADADALAEAIVAAATGCAATYGSDLSWALRQHMGGGVHG